MDGQNEHKHAFNINNVDSPRFFAYVLIAVLLLFAQKFCGDTGDEVQLVARHYTNSSSSYHNRFIYEPRFDSKRLLILMKYYSVLSATPHEAIAQKFPKKMLNELLVGLRKERNNLMRYEDQTKTFYPKGQLPVSIRRSLSYYNFTLERAIRDVARRLQFYDR